MDSSPRQLRSQNETIDLGETTLYKVQSEGEEKEEIQGQRMKFLSGREKENILWAISRGRRGEVGERVRHDEGKFSSNSRDGRKSQLIVVSRDDGALEISHPPDLKQTIIASEI